jgi:AcrR family transcriptional regulator
MSPERTPPQKRRTQIERSAEMKQRLLDATVRCLAEKGYAATSTQDVVDRAGVSRGALAHHFASKTDLVAEAAAYLISNRIRNDQRKLNKLEGPDDLLAKRIRLLWESYQKTFPATIEYMVAARTDTELRKQFDERINAYVPPKTNAVNDWAALANDPSPRLTHYVIGCFIRGLCLEAIVNEPALVEDIFEKFVALLSGAVSPDPVTQISTKKQALMPKPV